jgi:hypothetical protein
MARLKIINDFKVGGPSILAEGCGINTKIDPSGTFPTDDFQPITPPCTITLTPDRPESLDWGCKCKWPHGCLLIPLESGKWTITFFKSALKDETTVPIDDDDATVTVGEHQTC